MRLVLQLPEPSRFWVRFTPRSWPGAGGLWTHIGRASIGRAGRTVPAVADPRSGADPLGDVLYLPPVARDLRGFRDEVSAAHSEKGTPVLVQLFPGEPSAPHGTSVYDLLRVLLERRLDVLGELPSGTTALWPLVSGITDDSTLVDEGLDRLAESGVAVVQALSLELTPTEKRRLAGAAGEGAFHALFHRSRPRERSFDRAAARRGFETVLPRPVPPEPRFRAENRRLGETLAVAGELWQRLGRNPAQGQQLFRAARWVDETRHDVVSLVRDGNLSVVQEIEGLSRELVEEAVRSERSSRLDGLWEEYLNDEEIDDD